MDSNRLQPEIKGKGYYKSNVGSTYYVKVAQHYLGCFRTEEEAKVVAEEAKQQINQMRTWQLEEREMKKKRVEEWRKAPKYHYVWHSPSKSYQCRVRFKKDGKTVAMYLGFARTQLGAWKVIDEARKTRYTKGSKIRSKHSVWEDQ